MHWYRIEKKQCSCYGNPCVCTIPNCELVKQARTILQIMDSFAAIHHKEVSSTVSTCSPESALEDDKSEIILQNNGEYVQAKCYFRAESCLYKQLCTSDNSTFLYSPSAMGKSSSIIFFTGNFKYAIKVIRKNEFTLLLDKNPRFLEYFKLNPQSYLAKYLEIYEYRTIKTQVERKKSGMSARIMSANCCSLPPTSETVYFVVMENIFQSMPDHIYDLKGLHVNRTPIEGVNYNMDINIRGICEELLDNSLKDQCSGNIKEKSRKAYSIKCAHENTSNTHRGAPAPKIIPNLLVDQLFKDIDFLAELNMMDYSLIIGIVRSSQDIKRELNRRYNSPVRNAGLSMVDRVNGEDARRETKDSNMHDSVQYLQNCSKSRADGSIINISFGIVDTLTVFSFRKRIERLWNMLTCNCEGSAVNPEMYKNRFKEMIENMAKQKTD